MNAILRGFHDGVAALRRYLVDDQFLTRRDGIDWGTDGAVEA